MSSPEGSAEEEEGVGSEAGEEGEEGAGRGQGEARRAHSIGDLRDRSLFRRGLATPVLGST